VQAINLVVASFGQAGPPRGNDRAHKAVAVGAGSAAGSCGPLALAAELPHDHHYQDAARGQFTKRRLERAYGNDYVKELYREIQR
jgi:hypothetical protein